MDLEKFDQEIFDRIERLINTPMEQKIAQPTTTIPADFLTKVEFLPDGTATDNQQLFIKSWAEFAQKQVAQGKIKLEDVADYDPETGQVPNTYIIKEVYMKNRKLS